MSKKLKDYLIPGVRADVIMMEDIDYTYTDVGVFDPSFDVPGRFVNQNEFSTFFAQGAVKCVRIDQISSIDIYEVDEKDYV